VGVFSKRLWGRAFQLVAHPLGEVVHDLDFSGDVFSESDGFRSANSEFSRLAVTSPRNRPRNTFSADRIAAGFSRTKRNMPFWTSRVTGSVPCRPRLT
jgi:hypothetical protein